MLRAILKLVAVSAVIVVCGSADSIELSAIGGGALVLLPFVVTRIDRIAQVDRPAQVLLVKAATTLDVIPLPRPVVARDHDDDVEGVTTRAPVSHEEAYEMHQRYAPGFDQQAAIARYCASHADQESTAHQAHVFDQHRYAAALQYAQAFESQLAKSRRTSAYQVAPPRRMARGSVTPQRYRALDTRSDQRAWDEDTLVGVHPLKSK